MKRTAPRDQPARRIYAFADAPADGARDLLGNKGANLADMARAGLPVPPGFTITTAVCREYLSNGRRLARGVDAELRRAMRRLERETGKRFGDARRPLLVAVRSGAAVARPPDGFLDGLGGLAEGGGGGGSVGSSHGRKA